jgi:hypothetical protein
MPRKDGINKSQAIRDLLHENPKIKAQDAIDRLSSQGIDVAPSLFYFTKGKVRGRRGRRRQMKSQVGKVMGSTVNGDIVSTIKKVKALAHEVGGYKKLHALIEALHV